MGETLLSWAIARNAAVMDNQQLSDYIVKKSNVYIDQFVISSWRNGWSFPNSKKQRDALVNTFNCHSYAQFLIPEISQAMSVLFVATKMGISPDILRSIRLREKTQKKLMSQMREAVDITGDEYAAIGVAVSFWESYFSRRHPILMLRVKLTKKKGEQKCQKMKLIKSIIRLLKSMKIRELP